MRWLLIGGGGCLMLVVLALVGFAGCLAAFGGGSDETSKDPQSTPKAEIGEPLRIGNVTWIVEDAKTATELTSSFEKPVRGHFVVVNFTFTNEGKEAATLDTASMTLVDDEGRKSEADPDKFGYIPDDRNIFLENVNPGVTDKGQAIFTVAPDATGLSLELGGGQPIGVEKASAFPGNPYVEDIALNAFEDSSGFWHSMFVGNGLSWGDSDLYWVYDEPVSIPCDNGVLYPAQGPVYCPADWGIYYQVDFVAKEYGDGAVAATVAHEMGHHVQTLLDIPHIFSYTKELEADCLAGVYMADAWHRGLVNNGDYYEAYEMFGAIGDDAAWNEDGHHGAGQERQDWFELGWQTENPARCRTTI